jgi:hypothetical protein
VFFRVIGNGIADVTEAVSGVNFVQTYIQAFFCRVDEFFPFRCDVSYEIRSGCVSKISIHYNGNVYVNDITVL